MGPNGTGKSTLVSALCLGLAGRPGLLGRGDKIGLFVKKGEAKATVELELARAVGGDVVVRREIYAASNSSTWFLSGRSASQKQVEELVSSFNIQLSNLCQFLPQEKVGEFAKLSRVDRLEATEKSVGSSDLYDLHQRLKVLQKSRSSTEATLLERSARLENLSERQRLQTHDVELFHSHQRHHDYAQLLGKKRVWLVGPHSLLGTLTGGTLTGGTLTGGQGRRRRTTWNSSTATSGTTTTHSCWGRSVSGWWVLTHCWGHSLGGHSLGGHSLGHSLRHSRGHSLGHSLGDKGDTH
ncbi:structural maintenance of chromosomes protein 5-like [Petromyzon marinus]|uniref:structural maintenance of chromosomes protein 5-like n=1 Tax=Petromyzon marinus TaxID=7757 RepID=UPI003F6FC195